MKKDVVKETKKTVVYHFAADDLRKRLKLPDGALLTVAVAGGVYAVNDVTTLDVEVTS